MYALLVAPALETAVMLAVASVMGLVAPRHVVLRIVVVALLGAWAHRIGGDWRQVVRTLWPMLIYAGVLVLWLRRSTLDAFVVTTHRARRVQRELLRRRRARRARHRRSLSAQAAGTIGPC